MTQRTLSSSCRAVTLGLFFATTAACGTAPPVAPAKLAPAPAALAAAPAVTPVAAAEPQFADAAVVGGTVVGSVVTASPRKITGDLDALSRRLQLPMLLGRELVSSLAGMGVMGDSAHFNAVWDRLDEAAPIAIVWVLQPKSRIKGFCAAMTFRDAAGARKTFEEMGAAGAQRNGVSERRTPDGDVIWGGVKGRTLFISGSADALLLAGGLAAAEQAKQPAGQAVVTVLPQALLAASGKSREAVVSEAAALMTREAQGGGKPMTEGFRRMIATFTETAAKLALDSSAVRIVLDLGPEDGLLLQSELVPVAGTEFATRTSQRWPYAFDQRLPIRDDSTAVMAVGAFSAWLPYVAKMFEATGPAGQGLMRATTKLFDATGEWSCVFEQAEAGFATLCSSPLKKGTSSKAALDAAVALAKAQHAWEAELYGQKLTSPKIKRSRGVVEIEKKIENKDAEVRAMAKAFAGGDTVKTAFTVRDGQLLQATGRDARKTLARYGVEGGTKGAPLVAAALERGKGAEGMASVDVVSMGLRMLKQGKELPGNQLATMAGALPGLAEMKAPFSFALRGGKSLTGDFRISLGSLESIAKVVRGMMGAAGAGPSK